MVVTRPRQPRCGVVQPGHDMNVITKRSQWREAGGHGKPSTRLSWNPVLLRNAVAVEPEHQTRRNRSTYACGIGAAVGGEHCHQWRQPDRDGCSGDGSQAAQKKSPGECSVLSDYR